MNDRIEIELDQVHFHSHHGVFDQERRVGNEFVVSLRVGVPVTSVMCRDSIDGTISYADLYTTIKRVMDTPADTLEYVALCIAEQLKEEFPTITDGCVTVCKPQPPIPGYDGKASVTYRF